MPTRNLILIKRVLTFIAVAIITGSLITAMVTHQHNATKTNTLHTGITGEIPLELSSLPTIFKAYGFTEEEQKSIIRLLYLAGSFEKERLSKDLQKVGLTVSNVTVTIPDRQTYQSSLELEKTLNWLILVTQREFFARKTGEERWQSPTKGWINANEREIKVLVKRLNLCSAVQPKHKTVEAVAIFGSTTSNMEARLKFAKDLIDNGKLQPEKLILLAGERPVNKQADIPSDKSLNMDIYLKKIAADNHITVDQITETQLSKEIHERLVKSEPHKLFAKVPTIVVDAPKGAKPRPNTIDTLNQLLKNNSEFANAGRIIFVSSAPYIGPQYEDVLTVFGANAATRLEVVGSACPSNAPLNLILGALGGRLFGGYVNKSLSLGIPKSKEQLVATLKTLSFDVQLQDQSTRSILAN